MLLKYPAPSQRQLSQPQCRLETAQATRTGKSSVEPLLATVGSLKTGNLLVHLVFFEYPFKVRDHLAKQVFSDNIAIGCPSS